MASFDIISEVEEQEIDNAINQSTKEITQRYDFKDTKSEINWSKGEDIVIIGDDDYKLKAVVDILQSKFVKRGISLKSFEYGSVEDSGGGLKKQSIKIIQGISQEKAKEIVKFVKALKIKVQAQIQGDQLRVTGKKLDDLQAVIAEVKAKGFDLELQFVNMRS
ncbi:MAG: YajQ family cyclic di-GMP-binding protein [Deltaproteobacteria bacterium]|nr:YajQ family cyclic di-GMP-binding protein [Deltaproteobacteria bacterium]